MSPKQPSIEKLQRDLAQADAIAQQKSNFLATMSHEIRTPMQSVYGLLELIEQEKPDSNILSMVQTAKNSASGLLEILDDILEFAKMDADQMTLDSFEVPVRTLIYGINEAMAVKVQGKSVDIKDDISKDVPFVVIGDPKRLRQILMNLMSNALKFTHEGIVTIKVSTECKVLSPEKNKTCLRFEVVDTGIGMEEEVCKTLFQPFTQEDNSTSRKYGGTGLGLSICKKLVSIMGGEIGVISKKGKGSNFWFEIPTEEVSNSNPQVEMPSLDGLSILSVEDHPQGAKEIMRSLQSMGALVENCTHYAEGLELAMRRPFDVAIIDQGLPDGLGLDLIRELMQLRPFMGYIMYTVREDAGLQHTLQSLGVTYLTKPASRLGLGEAVQDAASKTKQMSIEGNTKMLVAEDTPSVRDILKRQLDKLGVDADFVENGKQAWDALQSDEYGILLTDLHMPEMDGYELIKKIRNKDEQIDKHFPVISLTADVQMGQRQVFMSHGFDECLLKPVSLGQFQRLLIRWGLLAEDRKEIKTESKTNSSSPLNENKKAAIDLISIEKQMGQMDDQVIEMLGMFADMTEPLVNDIETASLANNIGTLKEKAHSLKGAARSACANILGNYAEELQDAAEVGKNDSELIAKIRNEFERVKEEIKNM